MLNIRTTTLSRTGKLATSAALVITLSNCGGGGSSETANLSEIEFTDVDTVVEEETAVTNTRNRNNNDRGNNNDNDDNDNDNDDNLDQTLRAIIDAFPWDTDPLAGRTLPDIEDPIAQLGKKLFYSKSLGGQFDSSCASCHHPTLGGADELSLAVGVDALDPEVVGEGRESIFGLPIVPRNSPTVFNAGLWDSSLFFDSRLESLGKETGANGELSDIRTPDTAFLQADPSAGANLVAAQARFPVTSEAEMRGTTFEAGSDNDQVRQHLAARIGNYGIGENELERNEWLAAFQEAYDSDASAEELITFDNIAHALGEFQRSMVFVDNPWQNYIDGDVEALTDNQKEGAILFFTSTQDGGTGCVNCHSGSLFSDELHHTVAFPQIGLGKGNFNNDDFGRERETGLASDRYKFRTPSLLNIEHTAPYGHTGPYATLDDVIDHYDNPGNEVEEFFDDNELCDLAQFESIDNCQQLYSYAEVNSEAAVDKLQEERDDGTSLFLPTQINNAESNALEAFLQALTDPCLEDRDCLSPWIANDTSDNPDDQVLIAEDQDGNLL